MPAASTGASVITGAASPSRHSSLPVIDSRMAPGGPGYRRMSFALFLAGVATFALLYSTQALLPLISGDFGVSASDASWTVSAATGALALFVLPMSALSERFRAACGDDGVAGGGGVGRAAGALRSVAGRVDRAARGAGRCAGGAAASATAYLAEEVRPKALITAIGLFVAGNSVGGMSGRVITGWVAQEWGWRVAVAVIGVVALGCAVAFRALLPAPRHFRTGSLRPRVLVRTVRTHLANPLLRRLYAIGALFMTVFGGVYTVIGYRLTEAPFGLPQGIVGSVFLVYLVGTVSASTAGRLVARLGRRGALYLAGGTTTAGLLLSLSDTLALVLLGLVLITAGFFAGHAVASSAVSHTAKEGRAQASALYQSAYYIGSSAGSTLGAVAFHAGGWSGTVGMGLLAVLGVVTITVMGSRAARTLRIAAAA